MVSVLKKSRDTPWSSKTASVFSTWLDAAHIEALAELNGMAYPGATILNYPGAPPPTAEEQQAIDYLSSLLGKTLRLTLIDGRTLIGRFAAVDKLQNIILTDSEILDAPLPTEDDRPEGTSAEEWQVHVDELRAQRESVELYWPKSEPVGGFGTGYGGKEMGLVLVKGDQTTKIELLADEDERHSTDRRPSGADFAGMGII